MKEILMMIQKGCPYCRRAFEIMDELGDQHPEYTRIPVKIVDEQQEKEFADSLDYWYVPTYFVNGQKLHEGVPTPEKIQAVYEAALL